jgi:hypothetical protein
MPAEKLPELARPPDLTDLNGPACQGGARRSNQGRSGVTDTIAVEAMALTAKESNSEYQEISKGGRTVTVVLC